MPSSLRVRWSHTEHVLRSVDESPGVIGIAAEDGISRFIIDTGWLPDRAITDAMKRAGTAGVVVDVQADPPKDARVLDLAELLDACESSVELMVCLNFAAANIQACVTHCVPRGDFERVADSARFALEVRDAVAERLTAGSEG